MRPSWRVVSILPDAVSRESFARRSRSRSAWRSGSVFPRRKSRACPRCTSTRASCCDGSNRRDVPRSVMWRPPNPPGPPSLTDASTIIEPDPRYDLFDYEKDFLRQLMMQPNSMPQRTLNCLTLSGVEPQAMGNHRLVRAIELPSSNGVGTASAMAGLAAFAMQGGRLDGQRIFQREDTMRRALEMADDYAVDAMMGTTVQWSQGGFARLLAHDDEQTPTFGWGGAGGQMVRWVPSLGIGCAYLTNTSGIRMAMNDPRPNLLLTAAIDCAGRVDLKRNSRASREARPSSFRSSL